MSKKIILATHSTSNKNWKKYALGDICNIVTGKLNSSASNIFGKYPFFTCSKDDYKINSYSFDCEAILLAGNNVVGDFGIKHYTGKFDVYQRTYVITLKNTEKFDYNFLYYALKHNLRIFQRFSLGTVTQYLTMEILKPFELFIPEFSEQQKIGKILSSFDKQIKKFSKMNVILEKMLDCVFKSRFVNFDGCVDFHDSELGPIPTGWKVILMKDMVELCYGKSLVAKDRQSGKIPVYGSSGIIGFHNKSFVQGPGIIVGRKGNVGSIYWSEDNFWPIDTVFFIKSSLPLQYVYQVLKNLNFLNSDSSVPGLQRNQVYSLPVIIPSSDSLQNFELFSKKFHHLISYNNSMIKNLEITQASLIDQFMQLKI